MRKLFYQSLLVVFSLSEAIVLPAYADDLRKQESSHIIDCDMVGRTFSAASGAIVLKAQEFMSNDDYLAMLTELETAAALPNLNAFEKSIIYQMQGAAFYELGQFDNAVTAFDLALSSDGLCPDEYKQLRLNIAQLLIADKRYVKGAHLLEELFNEDPNLDVTYEVMIYQAWIKAGQYDQALPWAERWYARTGSDDPTNVYQTLIFLYGQLGMTEKQADMEEQMAGR